MDVTLHPSDEQADVFDKALGQLGYSERVIRGPDGENTLTWNRPIEELLWLLTFWAGKGDHASNHPVQPRPQPAPSRIKGVRSGNK